MHRTCESRWFLSPEDPAVAHLEAFFTGVAADRDGEIDAYLATSQEVVGIKVRGRGRPDAKLEIKLRQGALGPIALRDGVTAMVELWSKALATPGSDLQGETLVDVHKVRRVRRWALCGETPEERTPAAGEVASHVELTRVRREGRTSVTFGIETHGHDADLVGAHLAVLRLVLDQTGEVELGARDAIGYPAWLLL